MNKEMVIRDIHLPESVSWWPLASGWWLLILLVVFFSLLTYQKLKKYSVVPTKAFEQDPKKILAEAQKILIKLEKERDDQTVIKEISVLLRRTAMSLYGRERVAGLTKEEWLSFLDEKGRKSLFSQGNGRILIDQPYKKYTHYDRSELAKISKEWLNVQALNKSGSSRV